MPEVPNEEPAEETPPFTAEQVAWLDARYSKSFRQLEQDLAAQGKSFPGDEPK